MIKTFRLFRAAVAAAACVGGLSSVALGAPLRVSVMGDSYSSWNPANLPGHYAASCAANSSGYGFGFAGTGKTAHADSHAVLDKGGGFFGAHDLIVQGVQANTFTVHGLLSRATEARGAVYSFSEPFVPLPWSNASGRFRAFGRVLYK